MYSTLEYCSVICGDIILCDYYSCSCMCDNTDMWKCLWYWYIAHPMIYIYWDISQPWLGDDYRNAIASSSG